MGPVSLLSSAPLALTSASTIDALEACLGMSNTEGPTVDWSRVNETMPAVTVNPESMALFEARRTSLRACLNELSVLMPSRAG